MYEFGGDTSIQSRILGISCFFKTCGSCLKILPWYCGRIWGMIYIADEAGEDLEAREGDEIRWDPTPWEGPFMLRLHMRCFHLLKVWLTYFLFIHCCPHCLLLESLLHNPARSLKNFKGDYVIYHQNGTFLSVKGGSPKNYTRLAPNKPGLSQGNWHAWSFHFKSRNSTSFIPALGTGFCWSWELWAECLGSWKAPSNHFSKSC